MSSKTDEKAEDVDGTAQDAPKPKSKRRLIILAALGLAILGGGAGGYFFLMPDEENMADAEEHTEKEKAPAKEKMADGAKKMEKSSDSTQHVVAPFKEIIVNITSITARGEATSRFLKLNISLVYNPHMEGADRLSERQVFIRDSYIDFLRQLNERDLSGSAGIAQLKSELLHRARSLAETEAPQEILIADMVIQ